MEPTKMVEPTQNGSLIPGWRVGFCPETPKSLKPLVVSGQNSKFTYIRYRAVPGKLLRKNNDGFSKNGGRKFGVGHFRFHPLRDRAPRLTPAFYGLRLLRKIFLAWIGPHFKQISVFKFWRLAYLTYIFARTSIVKILIFLLRSIDVQVF